MPYIWRNIIISSLIGIAIYLFVFYSETTVLPNILEQWPGIVLSIILVNLIGLGLIYTNRLYNNWLQWSNNVSLRFFIEVCTGLLLSALAVTVFIFGFLRFNYNPESPSYYESLSDGLIKFGILSLVSTYIYSLINFSIYSYNQYSVGQIEALASERVQLDLRFEALKSQLNPHFLFNALNTISSLIYLNKNQAEKYIRILAQTYNYIIETNGDKIVTIVEEIEMSKAYFYMHKIRYEDFVELRINKNLNGLKGFIPPFTLQILVENALKHNVISEKSPLIIQIYKNSNSQIVVKNNIVERPVHQSTMENLMNKQKQTESYQIGLSNISRRYKFLVNKDIDIISGKYFKVKVPIIKNNNGN